MQNHYTRSLSDRRNKFHFVDINEKEICQNDPIYFIENYLLENGIELYDYQKKMIDMFRENPNSIAFGSRQVGLTFVLELYLTWLVLFNRDQKVLLLSHAIMHSKHMVHEVLHLISKALKKLPLVKVEGAFSNKFSLSNGSYIQSSSVSPTVGRGHDFSLIVVDNAAFVKESQVIKDLIASLNCNSIFASCSNGRDELFYDAWISPNNFAKQAIHWTQHPIFGKDVAICQDGHRDGYYSSPWYREQCENFLNNESRISCELDLSFDEEYMSYEEVDSAINQTPLPGDKIRSGYVSADLGSATLEHAINLSYKSDDNIGKQGSLYTGTSIVGYSQIVGTPFPEFTTTTNGYITTTATTLSGNLDWNNTTTSTATFGNPTIDNTLIETIVTEETIELIYKSIETLTIWISNGLYNPQSTIKIFKEVYGRFDGSKKIIYGKYIPQEIFNESYEF